jgi:hypothetical protein
MGDWEKGKLERKDQDLWLSFGVGNCFGFEKGFGYVGEVVAENGDQNLVVRKMGEKAVGILGNFAEMTEVVVVGEIHDGNFVERVVVDLIGKVAEEAVGIGDWEKMKGFGSLNFLEWHQTSSLGEKKWKWVEFEAYFEVDFEPGSVVDWGNCLKKSFEG